MSDKNQNNTSWRNRLDELDSLPHENISGKNASWEKLHDRLKEKPTRKKTYWYLAAACLFAITLLTLNLYNYQQSSSIPQINTVQKNTASFNIKAGIQENKTNLDVNTQKNNTVISKNKADEKLIRSKKTFVRKENVQNEITPLKEPVLVITKSSPIVDSTAAVVNIPKKRLRVVHINELPDPGQSIWSSGNNENNQFKKFARLPGKDVSLGTPSSPKTNGEHILIRNLNSQN